MHPNHSDAAGISNLKIHKTLSLASNRDVGSGGSAQEGGVGGGFSRERMFKSADWEERRKGEGVVGYCKQKSSWDGVGIWPNRKIASQRLGNILEEHEAADLQTEDSSRPLDLTTENDTLLQEKRLFYMNIFLHPIQSVWLTGTWRWRQLFLERQKPVRTFRRRGWGIQPQDSLEDCDVR